MLKLFLLSLVTLCLTNSVLGTIVSYNLLRNKSGQLVIIYGDRHLPHTVEQDQSSLIIKNLENLLDSSYKSSVLYEGITFSPLLLDIFCTLKPETPLWQVTQYFNKFNGRSKKLSTQVQETNIDNREHLADAAFFGLKLLIGLAKNDPVSILTGVKLSKNIDNPELYQLKPFQEEWVGKFFWNNLSKVWSELKSSLELFDTKFETPMKAIVFEQVELIDSFLEFLKTSIGTYGFKVLTIDSVFERIQQYSVTMQDLNTLMAVLANEKLDKQIIFVGNYHASLLKDWLQHSSFELVDSYTVESFLNGDDNSLSLIPNNDFMLINKNLDLITSAHHFYKNNFLDHQAKEAFSKLMIEIKQEIAQPPYNAPQWYSYSLEDMLENMTKLLTTSKDITIDKVNFYKKNWISIKKDFAVGPYRYLTYLDDKNPLTCPLVPDEERNSEARLYFNSSNNLNYQNFSYSSIGK